MRKFRSIFTIVIALVLSLFLFMKNSNADEVPPTSTIGSIDGPADVGITTIPTETTIFVDQCLYVGDPNIGQTEYGLAPCDLNQTTTTVVSVDTPPTLAGAQKLPSTGNESTIFIIVGFALVGTGIGLLRVRRHL